jgi:hypothetical protein
MDGLKESFLWEGIGYRSGNEGQNWIVFIQKAIYKIRVSGTSKTASVRQFTERGFKKALVSSIMIRLLPSGFRADWWGLPMRLNLQTLWEEHGFKSMLAELEADMIARRETVIDSADDTIFN